MSSATSIPPSPGDPLLGRTFGGKYQIVRMVGRGGIGRVYLATALEGGADVVVKVLAPDWLGDEEAEARFDREATRLGELAHPNIVAMLDHGCQDGRAYLVMEHLEGALLSEYVEERGRLDITAFVPIAAQILKGIGHAHSRELMVRDVKPANIMLCDRKGRANFVKILDFGLAKLLKDDKPVTEEHLLGTVGYLAPEAIRGESVDLRVDVYAIGVLFYYMLSGRLPFEGNDGATIFYKTAHDPPPPLGQLLPGGHDVPSGVVELIHQCLAKDPDDRPADANAIVEMLIDAVPAALFRLPRSTGAHAIPTASLAGNTGMVELIGVQAAAAATGSQPIVAPHEVSSDDLQTSPLDDASTTTGPVATAPSKPGLGLVAGSLIAGALMALLGGGAAALLLGDDDAHEPQAQATAQASAAATDADEGLEEAIADAERLIREGQLDDAERALDRLRGEATQTPAWKGRLDRVDRALLVARLMETAKTFEESGDVAAAMGAYRDVLAAEPAHAKARAALSRLGASGTEPEASDAVVYGEVEIDADPAGSLYIDGEPRGTTPFRGKLPVGQHEIRVAARGHQSWEGTLQVEQDGNEPLSVHLPGKGAAKPKVTPKKGDPAEASSSPPPQPPPAESKNPPKQPERGGVFLPTKKSGDDGGVFLPTKE